MSRYKKVVSGEMELPEVSGTKFVIYPTVETRMEVLEHIKATQIVEEFDEKDDKGRIVGTRKTRGKFFNIPSIAKTCSKMIWEACFVHDASGKRLQKRDDEKDTTEDQILALVLESDIMSLYIEILIALNIVSKEKATELKSGMGDAEKK